MRRLLERQQIATSIKGDQIGESDNDGNSTGDTKTSTKTSTIKAKPAITSNKTIEAGSTRKKRKVNEMKRDEDGLTEIKDDQQTGFFKNSAK